MRQVKSHVAGSALVAFGFAVAMMGTTLPTPLYPLYDRAFGLAPFLTPVIFATYALGVVATLLFFGYLSDEIGRRPVMAAALLPVGGPVRAGLLVFLFFAMSASGQLTVSRIPKRLDSAYFVLLYCGVALPVVGVGFVALPVGMVTAGLLFCGIVGVCVLGVLYTLRRQSVRQGP